jgi:hypothetical protein
MAATSNAPGSLAELHTLLANDIKVKVAGEPICMIIMALPWLTFSRSSGVDGKD